MGRPRILFIYPWPDDTFIRRDELLLREHYEVEVLHFRRALSFYRALVSQLARRPRPDLVYLWFMLPDYAPLVLWLCRRHAVPLVLVTGGYDVASIPSIHFGNMRKPHHRFWGRRVLGGADLILPFSEFAAAEVRRWAAPRRMVPVYPGIDTGFFTPPPDGAARAGVLTVGTINPLFNIQKGHLTFARASWLLPGVPFRIVGKIADPRAAEELRRAGGSNLELLGRRVSNEELLGAYRAASVYAQLSAHEGFGIAVAEAMACGALAVGCAGTATPEVVGDAGEVVPFGDSTAAAVAIQRSLCASADARKAARSRIEANFTPRRREEKLIELLGELLARARPPG